MILMTTVLSYAYGVGSGGCFGTMCPQPVRSRQSARKNRICFLMALPPPGRAHSPAADLRRR